MSSSPPLPRLPHSNSRRLTTTSSVSKPTSPSPSHHNTTTATPPPRCHHHRAPPLGRQEKKRKSTESESDSDFEVGTFDKYNRVECKKKGKRPAVEKNSDSEDELCAKKKRKGNKQEYNMIVAYKAEAEATDVDAKSKKNDRKTLSSRNSPRNLKRVLESLTTTQQKHLKEMGFVDFEGNLIFIMCQEFNGILALWVVKNFNPKTYTLVMEDGSMIKITRVLIHDMLGIPMGDIKVKSLKEKNLFNPVTAK
ncbi:hypothetical protein Tco_0602449 [Tanacetum coccineum]